MNKKVIITDHLHSYLYHRLMELGFEVDVHADITNDELFEIIDGYTGLVISTKIKVTTRLIDKARELKFIARAGSGMENIDVAYAQTKNLHVINSPEGNANAVGEHTLGMLLSLLNNISKADHEIRNDLWQREKNRGVELDGKTIGIVGYGHTGSSFAKKLRGFDVKILAYDKYKSGFGNDYVTESSHENICRDADIISWHVPLTKETFHYVNNHYIQNCKKNFWLINVSRGGVVHTKHLIEALLSGKIKGAGLDVFENENYYQLSGEDLISMNMLKQMENVIVTPHIAGWTFESYYKISYVLAQKIESLKI